MSASAISVAAVVLATALVAYFRPGTEPPLAPERETPPVQPVPVANEPAAAPPVAETVVAPPPREAGAAAARAPGIEPAPLPGATAATPMADLMAGRANDGPPLPLIEGERAFAAEPVDRTWAPATEASIYARLAEIPGLKLTDLQVECRSTMCRLQMASGGSSLPSFKELFEPIALRPAWMAMMKDPAGQRSFAYLWRDGFGPQQPELGQPHEAN
jgi:hypothetical protein